MPGMALPGGFLTPGILSSFNTGETDLGSNPDSAMHLEKLSLCVLTKNGPRKMEVIITTVKGC